MKALITETTEVLSFKNDYRSTIRHIDGADLILQIIDSPRKEVSDKEGHRETMLELESVAEFQEWDKILGKFSSLDNLLCSLSQEQLDTFIKYSNNGIKSSDLDVDLQSVEHDIRLAHNISEGTFVPDED